MELVGLIAATGSLIKTGASTISGLRILTQKFGDAPESLQTIQGECSTVNATLEQIVSWMKSGNLDSSEANKSRIAHLHMAISNLQPAMETLRKDVLNIQKKQETRQMNRRGKFRYIWHEPVLRGHLEEVRWQSQALSQLLVATNLSIEQSNRRLKDVATDVSLHSAKVIDDTQSMLSESFDTEFSFDDTVVDSRAYRRAFGLAIRKSVATLLRTATGSEAHWADPSLETVVDDDGISYISMASDDFVAVRSVPSASPNPSSSTSSLCTLHSAIESAQKQPDASDSPDIGVSVPVTDTTDSSPDPDFNLSDTGVQAVLIQQMISSAREILSSEYTLQNVVAAEELYHAALSEALKVDANDLFTPPWDMKIELAKLYAHSGKLDLVEDLLKDASDDQEPATKWIRQQALAIAMNEAENALSSDDAHRIDHYLAQIWDYIISLHNIVPGDIDQHRRFLESVTLTHVQHLCYVRRWDDAAKKAKTLLEPALQSFDISREYKCHVHYYLAMIARRCSSSPVDVQKLAKKAAHEYCHLFGDHHYRSREAALFLADCYRADNQNALADVWEARAISDGEKANNDWITRLEERPESIFKLTSVSSAVLPDICELEEAPMPTIAELDDGVRVAKDSNRTPSPAIAELPATPSRVHAPSLVAPQLSPTTTLTQRRIQVETALSSRDEAYLLSPLDLGDFELSYDNESDEDAHVIERLVEKARKLYPFDGAPSGDGQAAEKILWAALGESRDTEWTRAHHMTPRDIVIELCQLLAYRCSVEEIDDLLTSYPELQMDHGKVMCKTSEATSEIVSLHVNLLVIVSGRANLLLSTFSDPKAEIVLKWISDKAYAIWMKSADSSRCRTILESVTLTHAQLLCHIDDEDHLNRAASRIKSLLHPDLSMLQISHEYKCHAYYFVARIAARKDGKVLDGVLAAAKKAVRGYRTLFGESNIYSRESASFLASIYRERDDMVLAEDWETVAQNFDNNNSVSGPDFKNRPTCLFPVEPERTKKAISYGKLFLRGCINGLGPLDDEYVAEITRRPAIRRKNGPWDQIKRSRSERIQSTSTVSFVKPKRAKSFGEKFRARFQTS